MECLKAHHMAEPFSLSEAAPGRWVTLLFVYKGWHTGFVHLFLSGSLLSVILQHEFHPVCPCLGEHLLVNSTSGGAVEHRGAAVF